MAATHHEHQETQYEAQFAVSFGDAKTQIKNRTECRLTEVTITRICVEFGMLRVVVLQVAATSYWK